MRFTLLTNFYLYGTLLLILSIMLYNRFLEFCHFSCLKLNICCLVIPCFPHLRCWWPPFHYIILWIWLFSYFIWVESCNICVCDWLISFSIRFSKFIHVVYWRKSFFSFLMFIYFQTDTEHEQGRGRKRGRHRIRSLWAVSTEPDAGLELRDWEIMTWAEVGHSTDWATQEPQISFFSYCWIVFHCMRLPYFLYPFIN